MDPNELVAAHKKIKANGWELLGIYHLHTHTAAYPSPADVESAFLPESLYIIIYLEDPDQAVIKGFRIKEGKVSEIKMQIDGLV